MDIKEVASLISDPTFQTSIRSLSEKTAFEQGSFIAVIASAFVALIALIVTAIQLKRQLQDAKSQLSLIATGIMEDYSRSRREFAISLIQYWTANHRHESQSTRNFVEELDADQCKDLFNYKPLKIDLSKIGLLVSCLQHSFPEVTEQNVLEDGTVRPV